MSKLVKEVFLYGVTGVLAKAMGIFLVPVYTRILLPSEMGTVSIFNTIFAGVSILSDLQIIHGMGRYYFETEQGILRKKLIGSGYTASICISIFWACLLLFGAPLWSKLFFKSHDFSSIFYLLSLNLPLSISISYLNYVFRLDHNIKSYTAASLTSALVSLVSIVCLVAFLGRGITGIFLGQTIGFIAGNVIIYCVGGKGYYLISLASNNLKKIFAFCLPTVPSVAGSWAQVVFGQVIILSYISISDLGIYDVALKVSSLLLLFEMAFTLAWNPHLLAGIADNHDGGYFARGFNLYIAGGSLIAIPFVLLSKEFIGLIAGQNFQDATKLMGATAAAVFVQGIPMLVNVGIVKAKKMIFNTIAYFSGLAFNIIVTILLIRNYGVIAVPLGLLVGRITQSFILYLISQKYFRIKYSFKMVVFFCLLFVVLISLHTGKMDIPISYRLLLCIGLMAGVILISYKEIKVTHEKKAGAIVSSFFK